MRRGTFIAAAVAIPVLWLYFVRSSSNSIEYRGQQIKLSRAYLSYEDYKDDTNNIDASETARVQRLVSDAPIAHSFASRKDVVAAVFDIKFPGYGVGGFGDGKQDSDLIGFFIEIPRSETGRYLLFKKSGTHYILVDDFLDSSMPGINHVEESDGSFVYSMIGHPEKLVRATRKMN